MTNQAMANKGWFLHIGGQPQGPFTVEQVTAKFREGAINRDSHVWCEGMPTWATVKDIAELTNAITAAPAATVVAAPPPLVASQTPAPAPAPAQIHQTSTSTTTSASNFSGSASNMTEVSHLIELNPHEIDDTTAAIEPAKLRSAKKEAAVARKVERKIAVANSVVGVNSGEEQSRSLKALIFAVPLVACVGIGAAAYFKLVNVDDIKSQTSRFLTGLTSSFPAIEDVTPEAYEVLRAAADADIKTAGPQAAVAFSTQNQDRPVLYISSNMPDGTALSVQIKGDPKTVLTDQTVTIRFPIVITKHMAKSRNLHTPDSNTFPPGEYTVTVVPADEDQTPEANALLSNGKLMVTQTFFVGGAKDAAFSSKLDQLHQKHRDKALVEYKQGALLISKLEAQLTLASETSQQLQSAKKPNLKKIWDELSKKWTEADMEPLEKGNAYPDVFTSIHDIWAQGKKIHDLQENVIQGAADPTAIWSQVSALNADTSQKIAAVKSRLDAIAKELGAAPAAAGH